MKIKANVQLDLLKKYGFEESGKYNDYRENPFEEGQLSFLDKDLYLYFLTLGYSRRGQYYYLLISKDRTLCVVASKPDGDGGAIPLYSSLIKMVNDGILE